MPPLAFFGYGYCAASLHALAGRASSAAWATVRGAEKAAQLRARGLEANILDTRQAPAVIPPPPAGAAWLVSVPPDDEGCPIHRLYADEADSAIWIGYFSTTGVYGDRGGAWVTEDTPPAPRSRAGRRRLTAERQWQRHGAHLFRLPGIYGPGRSAIDRVRAGTARRIVKPGHLFSRVHVEDIARAALASMRKPDPGRIYNIVDDRPAPAADVVAYAARLCRTDPPPAVPFEEAGLSPSAARFYAENRRVSNARARTELGWSPRYPDYEAGLDAIAASESSKTSNSSRRKSSGRDNR